jgi:hypothetical protein
LFVAYYRGADDVLYRVVEGLSLWSASPGIDRWAYLGPDDPSIEINVALLDNTPGQAMSRISRHRALEILDVWKIASDGLDSLPESQRAPEG